MTTLISSISTSRREDLRFRWLRVTALIVVQEGRRGPTPPLPVRPHSRPPDPQQRTAVHRPINQSHRRYQSRSIPGTPRRTRTRAYHRSTPPTRHRTALTWSSQKTTLPTSYHMPSLPCPPIFHNYNWETAFVTPMLRITPPTIQIKPPRQSPPRNSQATPPPSPQPSCLDFFTTKITTLTALANLTHCDG